MPLKLEKGKPSGTWSHFGPSCWRLVINTFLSIKANIIAKQKLGHVMVSNGGPEAGLGASITTESYRRQLEVVSNPLQPAFLTPSKLQLR